MSLAKKPEPEPWEPPERKMPPKVNGIFQHGPLCDCDWCEYGPESGWQSGRYVRLRKEAI